MGVLHAFWIAQMVPNRATHHISVGQVRWPNDSRFKIYTQKCFLSRVKMLIMTSQLSKLMEWFKIRTLNISRTEHKFSMKWKIHKLWKRLYIFKSCHFLVEVTFKLDNFFDLRWQVYARYWKRSLSAVFTLLARYNLINTGLHKCFENVAFVILEQKRLPWIFLIEKNS